VSVSTAPAACCRRCGRVQRFVFRWEMVENFLLSSMFRARRVNHPLIERRSSALRRAASLLRGTCSAAALVPAPPPPTRRCCRRAPPASTAACVPAWRRRSLAACLLRLVPPPSVMPVPPFPAVRVPTLNPNAGPIRRHATAQRPPNQPAAMQQAARAHAAHLLAHSLSHVVSCETQRADTDASVSVGRARKQRREQRTHHRRMGTHPWR
jgi:hypothetical protein